MYWNQNIKRRSRCHIAKAANFLNLNKPYGRNRHMVRTILGKHNSRTFQGRIRFFQGLRFIQEPGFLWPSLKESFMIFTSSAMGINDLNVLIYIWSTEINSIVLFCRFLNRGQTKLFRCKRIYFHSKLSCIHCHLRHKNK